MAECSGSRFKPLEKPIEEYYRPRKQKDSSKNAAGYEATYSISAGENQTTKNWRNSSRHTGRSVSTATLVNSFLVWKEKMAKTMNHSRVVFKFQPVIKRTQILSEYYRRHCVWSSKKMSGKLAANNWKKKEKGTNPTQPKLWLTWRKTFFTERIYLESQMPKLC